MKHVYLAIILLIPLIGFSQIEILGEEVITDYNTSHPYSGNISSSYKIIWTQEISHNDASYIAVHFKQISLSPDDYLVIRNVGNTRSWNYRYAEIVKKSNSFWSIPIYGDKVIIEIYSKNSKGDYGYTIDKIATGFPENETKSSNYSEAICGSDDSENAICYSDSEPEVYNQSRAVARLLINGIGACTGWLVGDDGHLMTNEHCIENAADANNVTIEFMAEGDNCSSNCNSWFACPGTIEATSATLVRVNANLDYALLRMDTNVSEEYGFCQLRENGAELNERIYIPQHPGAWGKRIALFSDNTNDEDGFASVFSLNRSPCLSVNVNQIGYFADTRSGSSGSPVIGYNDNLVIALHNCANCPNRGVPIEDIIADLGSDLPHNAISNNCEEEIVISDPVFSTQFDDQSASKLIIANNTIFSGGSAQYQAGEKVRLLVGFSARSGSTLNASIGDCGESISNTSSKGLINTEVVYKDISSEFTSFTENEDTITIYPNPFNDIINIQTNEAIVILEILSIEGNVVHRQTEFFEEINTTKLSKGLYLIRITTKTGEVIIQKTIKN